MKPTLNLGCGDDERGDVRIDLTYAEKSLNKLTFTTKTLNVLADAHYLPIRNKAIGKTFCKSVLEHLEAPVKALREMKRITVDEIIIIVPNLINVRRIWRTLKNPLHKVSLKTRHLQGWDTKEIQHLANLTGLKVKKIEWRNEGPQRWGYICMPLFASHMIVIMKGKTDA